MKLDLPSSVYSHQDLQALLLEVQTYARWFSHAATKKRLHIRRASEPPALSAAAEELIRDWSVRKPLSQTSLDELMAALVAFRDNAPTATITLAAPPPTAVKKALVSWCRTNIASDLLVNFEFNALLLGGLVIRLGSHIVDRSFRQQLLDARYRFPEVLRHV